jgi:ABC-2 type transport system permease protein
VKKLLTLLKVSFLGFAGFNEMVHGKDQKRKNRKIGMFVLFFFVALMMLGTAFSSFYGMGYVLNQLGALDALLALACAGASVAVLITTVAKVVPTLFTFRDYELLMSLPIPERTLVLSRILRLYGANLFFMSFLILPAGAAYVVLSPQGVGFYVRFFMLLFFVPLLPLSIAAVVGTLIAAFGARFRRSNFITLVLLFTVFIGIMAISFAAPQVVEQIQSISAQLTASVSRFYPVATWYANAVVGAGSGAGVIDFLLFAGVSAAVFAVFVAVVARNFKRLNTSLRAKSAVRKKGNARRLALSPVRALYQKEIKRYFASTLYVFNTAFGAVLVVIGSVALAFMGEEKLGVMLEMPGLPDIMKSAAPFALALFACLSATTPASISMEGNKLWQLKALPVKTRDLFRSKCLVSITVMAPAIVVAATVLNFVLKADALTAVLMYAVPLVYTVFIARVGLYVNLCVPKLDWQNEAEVVKQGASVMVTLLIGMAAGILPIVWLTGVKDNAMLYGYILLAAIIALTAFTGVLLQKDGAKRFARL